MSDDTNRGGAGGEHTPPLQGLDLVRSHMHAVEDCASQTRRDSETAEMRSFGAGAEWAIEELGRRLGLEPWVATKADCALPAYTPEQVAAWLDDLEERERQDAATAELSGSHRMRQECLTRAVLLRGLADAIRSGALEGNR